MESPPPAIATDCQRAWRARRARYGVVSVVSGCDSPLAGASSAEPTWRVAAPGGDNARCVRDTVAAPPAAAMASRAP